LILLLALVTLDDSGLGHTMTFRGKLWPDKK
jgi:hypothetical protein